MRRAPPTAAVGLVVCGLAVVALARATPQTTAPAPSDAAHAPSPPTAVAASGAGGEGAPDAIGTLDGDAALRPESPDARALREGEPLDLNRATAEDLVLLPRIGPSLAARIVAHRAEHGPFVRLEDLEQVRGIGPRTVETLRPLATIGHGADSPP